MTVNELCEALSLKVLAGESGLDNQVAGCYIGDLLSWVMSRAEEKNVWITVMGNVNAVAVAKLTEVSCVLLCEDAHLDDDAKKQADDNGVPILSCGRNAYRLAVDIAELAGTGR